MMKMVSSINKCTTKFMFFGLLLLRWWSSLQWLSIAQCEGCWARTTLQPLASKSACAPSLSSSLYCFASIGMCLTSACHGEGISPRSLSPHSRDNSGFSASAVQPPCQPWHLPSIHRRLWCSGFKAEVTAKKCVILFLQRCHEKLQHEIRGGHRK